MYKFRSDPAMEPRDFGLKLNLVYFDQYQHPFLHLAFNDTISFVESVNSFDFERFVSFPFFLTPCDHFFCPLPCRLTDCACYCLFSPLPVWI